MEDLFNMKIGVDENVFIDTTELEGSTEKGSLKDEGKPKDETDKKGESGDDIFIDDEGNVSLTDDKDEKKEVVEKPKKEKEEKAKDKGNAGDNLKDKVTPKNFSPFATVIKEAGIIPDLDLEKMTEMTAEEQVAHMLETMEQVIEKRIEEGINDEPEELAYLKKHYRKGVPLKEILDVQEYNMNVNSVRESEVKKEDNKDLRANIIREYYRMTAPGMKRDKVEKLITDSQLSGDDVEEAVTYLNELKEIGRKEEDAMVVRAEKKKADDLKRYTDWSKGLKEKIEELEEVIPGIKLTKKQRDTVYNNMIRPVEQRKLEDGRTMSVSRAMQVREKNPDLFDIRLNALIEEGYFDEDIKKEKIIKKQKTAAISELEKELGRGDDISITKRRTDDTKDVEEQKSWFGSLNKITEKR
jgi:hypothetical protein